MAATSRVLVGSNRMLSAGSTGPGGEHRRGGAVASRRRRAAWFRHTVPAAIKRPSGLCATDRSLAPSALRDRGPTSPRVSTSHVATSPDSSATEISPPSAANAIVAALATAASVVSGSPIVWRVSTSHNVNSRSPSVRTASVPSARERDDRRAAAGLQRPDQGAVGGPPQVDDAVLAPPPAITPDWLMATDL